MYCRDYYGIRSFLVKCSVAARGLPQLIAEGLQQRLHFAEINPVWLLNELLNKLFKVCHLELQRSNDTTYSIILSTLFGRKFCGLGMKYECL